MDLSILWQAASWVATQKISQHVMKLERSLPNPQKHSTSLYPEPDQSNIYHPIISL
jgi:hypothetical protein